jgi:hypothetical protein
LNGRRASAVSTISTVQDKSKNERQRKLTIFDTKKQMAVLNLCFNSKIMKLEMNYEHLYVASKDYIFVFSLKDMQLISRVKVPNHLLRIVMNPNINPISNDGDNLRNNHIVLAYSGSLD